MKKKLLNKNTYENNSDDKKSDSSSISNSQKYLINVKRNYQNNSGLQIMNKLGSEN